MRLLVNFARADSGLTVAELLVACALMGVLAGTMFLVLNTTENVSNVTQAQSIAADEARSGLDKMTRELREAQELEDGKGVFQTAEPRRCVFWADTDADGVPERVTYWVSGTTLYRSEARATSSMPPYTFGGDGAPSIIMRSLKPDWSGAVFTYLSEGDSPQVLGSSAIADMSVVKLEVVDRAAAGNKSVDVGETTWVKIRSVHNNVN